MQSSYNLKRHYGACLDRGWFVCMIGIAECCGQNTDVVAARRGLKWFLAV